MNIASWLYAQFSEYPNAPALYKGKALQANYAEFAQASCALAKLLNSQYGCQKGDRIVIYSANCVEYLLAFYAIWWLGGVAVPINYRLHPKEAQWIIENTEAKVLIAGSDQLTSEIVLPTGCATMEMGSIVVSTLKKEAAITPPVFRELSDLAWIFYTSGTTGKPKGVMLSHQNLIAMSMAYPIDVHPIEASDCIYYAAPLSHGAGLYNFIFLRMGAKHILPASKGFDANDLIENAQYFKGMCFFAAPTILKRLTYEAKERGYFGQGIKSIVCGGAPLYVADYIEAEKQLGPVVTQIYGQGESPMTITSMKLPALAAKQGEQRQQYMLTVGSPHSCVDVRVVDHHMQDKPIGESGEIIVKGLTVMQGYWRNPEASAQTIVDGWLHTGDIGYLDKEGNLTLTSRSKEVIISGGSNVYPREVEEVLLRHRDIDEAAVVGEKNDDWGEMVVAHIVTHAKKEIKEDELKAWCKASLGSFKCPKKYVFHQELPKNNYGKIMKSVLVNKIN